MQRKKNDFQYPHFAPETLVDEDYAPPGSLYYPGFYLAHENSDCCWCEPVYLGEDDEGNLMFEHRRDIQ